MLGAAMRSRPWSCAMIVMRPMSVTSVAAEAEARSWSSVFGSLGDAINGAPGDRCDILVVIPQRRAVQDDAEVCVAQQPLERPVGFREGYSVVDAHRRLLQKPEACMCVRSEQAGYLRSRVAVQVAPVHALRNKIAMGRHYQQPTGTKQRVPQRN